MEEVLSVYRRAYDERFPVICMDEKPVQLLMDARKGFKSKKNGVEYYDNEYIRNGTASIFMLTEPLHGWRWTDARERLHVLIGRMKSSIFWKIAILMQRK